MADDKPKNADFIGRVVKDAKNPVETRMLSGWFGDSGEKGTRRLYTDAELTSYVDIPEDAILYTEPIKDSQPAGGVLVWIKRDASVQSGGSAASRAGQFLQGQIATDFGAPGSLEKAGLRCVTEVPCGEPTGFTGQCTKQPNVGGAWPCITAVPHCVEVTGFTGKCTHAPWPQPTRYIGCTVLHCPTNDLTHIPYICNIVASGQPGCVVVNPPQGGEVEKKAGAAADEKLPETAIPGCGYTKTWGLCETHLLGCGYTKTWGLCPTRPEICDPAGGQQANAAFGAAAPAAQAVVPTPTAPCISPTPCSDFVICQPTQMLNCNQTKAPTALCTPAPKVCDTFCGPNCQTKQVAPLCTSVNCVPPPTSPQLECTMICTHTGPQCPTVSGSPIICCAQPQNPAANAVGMNAAQAQICAAGTIRPTMWTQIQCPPTHLLGCGYTHNWGYQCPPHTQPPQCPVPSVICATNFCVTEACGLSQACQPGGGGQQQQFAQQAVGAPQTLICITQAPPCPRLVITATCPLPSIACRTELFRTEWIQQFVHPLQQFQQMQHVAGFAAQAPQGQFVGAPQTLATVCTQIGCPTHAPMLCMTHQLPCPTGGIDCTVICPTHQPLHCPTAPATICPTHLHPCPTQFLPHCPTAPATICPTHLPAACPPLSAPPHCPTVQACPVTAPPQCPLLSAPPNCPTVGACQSIACQSQACQPGGGGEQQFAAVGAQAPGTAATVCTQYHCPTQLLGCGYTHGWGYECPPLLSAPPHCPTVQACPVTAPPQCPLLSAPPNCPTVGACQSIVCQSQACQPGGGGEQQFAAVGAQAPGTAATVCTQYHCPTQLLGCGYTHGWGYQCPPLLSAPPHCPTVQACPVTAPPHCPLLSAPPNCPTVGACQSIACQSQACQPGGGQQQQFAAVGAQQFTPATVCTQFGCTQWGPGCPPTPATVCTQPDVCPPQQAQAFAAQQQPINTLATVCTQFGSCRTFPNGDCTFFGNCPPRQTLIPTCFVCTGHPCRTINLRCPEIP